MIEFLSSWAKSLGLSIVIVSILEMLLPNNKTKKYIRTVMGIYILLNIISPLIQNKEKFDLNQIEFENTQNVSSISVNQKSMDERIEELYIKELEKDIKKKIEKKGYEVTKCSVRANIGNTEEKTKITKIKIKIKKNEDTKEERKNIENIMVQEIQKIRIADSNRVEKDSKEKSVSNLDIKNIKDFLIQEYEVSEECLEIN